MTNGVLNVYVLEELARTRAADRDRAARRTATLLGGDRPAAAHRPARARVVELAATWAATWAAALVGPARRQLARFTATRTSPPVARPMGCAR